ncbi:MAG: tetratricopeptide repeat protein [Bacteroidia bacterium]|nr:tetratricopeptide repeat protein [Bacteroidia bacterium]
MKLWWFISVSLLCSTLTAQTEGRTRYVEGQRLEQANQIQAARRAYLGAIKADPTLLEARFSLASLYRRDEIYDSAVWYFESVLALNARHLKAHQELAAVYQLQGNFDKAISQYKLMLQHHPGYPQGYYGLAQTYFAQEQYQQAVFNSETAMRLYSEMGSQENAADARMLAAQGYFQQGDYDTALKYLKASKKYYEDKAYYPYYIGFCYLGLGEMDKARTYFAQAEVMGYKLPAYITERLK